MEQISDQTKFTKSEVKFLYRAFKTECPNGIIDEDTFKEVYEKIFPLGDASKYAMIVFRAIDRERTGGITFGDFMDFLSVITKGTDQQKILWSFQFFDVNQDGKITWEEMIKVICFAFFSKKKSTFFMLLISKNVYLGIICDRVTGVIYIRALRIILSPLTLLL